MFEEQQLSGLQTRLESPDGHGLDQYDLTQEPALSDTRSDDWPNALLNVFRKELARQLPFIVIPPTMSAHELCQTRPFLYKTVMMAASYKDLSRQMELSAEIMSYLTENLLLQGNKSLDILQGLLVYIFWQVNMYLAMRSD